MRAAPPRPRRGLEPQQDGGLGRAALGAQARAQPELAGPDEDDLGPGRVPRGGDGRVRRGRVGLGDGRDDGVEEARGRHERHRRRDELGDAEQGAVRAGHARPGQRDGHRQRALQPLQRRRDATQDGRPRAVDRGEDDERDLARLARARHHVLRRPGAPEREQAAAVGGGEREGAAGDDQSGERMAHAEHRADHAGHRAQRLPRRPPGPHPPRLDPRRAPGAAQPPQQRERGAALGVRAGEGAAVHGGRTLDG